MIISARIDQCLFPSTQQSHFVLVMDRDEVAPALAMAGELLSVKHKEEMTTDGHGSLLVLSAGEKGVRKKMNLDTTPGCIHLLNGLRKRWIKTEKMDAVLPDINKKEF